jgi:NDP-sugar pyrophosphorylase family protein
MTRELPSAAVLAGGLGTRIRSVAGGVPKVLLPVEGRPFLAHLLAYLARQRVRRVVLCLGYAAEQVWDAARAHLPDGMEIVPSREEAPLGTGGAVRLALPLLEDTFFVVNGDTYLEASLSVLYARHLGHAAVSTISLVRSEQAAEKGSVRVAPDGRVLEFVEKTPEGTGLINGGVYVTECSLFFPCRSDEACSLERRLLPAAIAAGETVLGVRVDAPFVDIGLPEDYLRVRDRLPRLEDWR